MTTYRLPDWLGGYEVNRLTDTATPGRVNVTLSKGEGLIIEIDLKDLVEVKPPQSPEPPNGTVLSNGIDAWIRCDDENDPDVGAWYCTGDKQVWAWDEVAPTITPGYRRYVPDPADDAPELPWKGADEEDDSIAVAPNERTVKVSISYESEHSSKFVLLKPATAAEAGRALLRAAREVQS